MEIIQRVRMLLMFEIIVAMTTIRMLKDGLKKTIGWNSPSRFAGLQS